MSAVFFWYFTYNESENKARQDKIQNGKQEMCPTSSVIIITAFVDKEYPR